MARLTSTVGRDRRSIFQSQLDGGIKEEAGKNPPSAHHPPSVDVQNDIKKKVTFRPISKRIELVRGFTTRSL